MSKKKEEEDADVADTNNEEEEDNNHDEATEILTNLLQNHQALPTYDDAAPPAAGAEGLASSSVTEGQQAAIQQMMQQLKLGGVALPNGATVAAVADGGEQGEKKHAFWDTQVRMRLREGGDKLVRCDEVSYYIAKKMGIHDHLGSPGYYYGASLPIYLTPIM